ncbi:hypothetical protein K443DRAFT_71044, partial [Laccaria amethystina LaAM-08-1]
ISKLQYLNKVKSILNVFEDSEITTHQFLHRLLSTNIFEDHPILEVVRQIWDPMLGLITDLRAPRLTFPAASLSR